MLRNNEFFPSLTFARAGGGEINLPGDLAGGFGVILFYRGSWSPTRNAQLAAFSRAAGDFAAEGIEVACVPMDDRETTEALVEKHKLGFPVGYGADPLAVSAAIGGLDNDDPAYLQATGFVLDPEGRIVTAVYSTVFDDQEENRIVTSVYSTGKSDRLMPDDVRDLVRQFQSLAKGGGSDAHE
jgi:peroxiredoxin